MSKTAQLAELVDLGEHFSPLRQFALQTRGQCLDQQVSCNRQLVRFCLGGRAVGDKRAVEVGSMKQPVTSEMLRRHRINDMVATSSNLNSTIDLLTMLLSSEDGGKAKCLTVWRDSDV